MNLEPAPREFVFIGHGPTPRKVLLELMAELTSSATSDGLEYETSFSFLPLEQDVPTDLFFKTVKAEFSSFRSYKIEGQDVEQQPWWLWAPPAYIWTETELDETAEPRTFLVMLDPEGGLTKELGLFLKEATEKGWPCYVINEGMWQIDRVDEDGLWEKMVEEAAPEAAVTEPEPEPEPEEETVEQTFYTVEGLEELSRDELKMVVNDLGVTPKDWRSKQSLIDAVLTHQGPLPLTEVFAAEEPEAKEEPAPTEAPTEAPTVEVAPLPVQDWSVVADQHRTLARAHLALAEFYDQLG